MENILLSFKLFIVVRSSRLYLIQNAIRCTHLTHLGLKAKARASSSPIQTKFILGDTTKTLKPDTTMMAKLY